MFPGRYFPSRFFNGRYWAKVGSSAVVADLAMCGDLLVRAIHLGRPRIDTAHKATTTARAIHKGRPTLGCPAD